MQGPKIIRVRFRGMIYDNHNKEPWGIVLVTIQAPLVRATSVAQKSGLGVLEKCDKNDREAAVGNTSR